MDLRDDRQKIIKSFTTKQVVRCLERTEHLVRSDSVVDRIINLLVGIRERNHGASTPESQRVGWKRETRRLCRDLIGPFPAMRVLRVVEWYADQPSWRVDPMIPRIDSGRSLREKFGRLEDCMLARMRKSSLPTVSEAISSLSNGSRVIAEAFEFDVLGKAREIDFGDVTELELVGALVVIYREITAMQYGAYSPGIGPLDVLRRYVNWLGEKKDWRMTTRVLSITSLAFQQWRRDEAALHPRGVDPLTGMG